MHAIRILLVFAQFIGVIKCGGILDLAFSKFIHNDSELQCDSAECDFKFVICLDSANGDNSDVEDCYYRRLEEFELPEVSINFNHWPGALLLKVAIFDRKPSSDELVDTLHALLEAEPGQGKQREMHSKTSLTVNFSVQCDKDFYGPLCSTFCVPQNNKIGHYTCDTVTGALVCHPGWKGRFCTDKVLEPNKIVDIDDNTLLPEDDAHPEDSTTIQAATVALIAMPSIENTDNNTDETIAATSVTLASAEDETATTNSTLLPFTNLTAEGISKEMYYSEENLTSAATENSTIFTTENSIQNEEINTEFATLMLGSDQKLMNELHKKDHKPWDDSMAALNDTTNFNERESNQSGLPPSDRNLGVLRTIVEALLADDNNLAPIKNETEIPDQEPDTQLNQTEETNISVMMHSNTEYHYENDTTTQLPSTYEQSPTSIPMSSTEMVTQPEFQALEVEVTMDHALNNSTLPTNLLEEALLFKKPPSASDDVSSLKKRRYQGDNTTNHVKEETQILMLEEINYKAHGEDNNNTELRFVFAMTKNPPLLNGSAGNLETVIRDVLRHEVGDETSDLLGIHFEIANGHLQYSIYAKNGSLPTHMAEKVLKLQPNIESAFVHLASTHHEAPSAVIPHKRRGIPEWGILTVIVGIVFIAIITMRQAQKYCGRTHKALKPQELHEEKDPESMPTTSAANFINPVYNST